jgi:hypothetical protein
LHNSPSSRRAFLGAAVCLPAALSIAACSQMSSKPRYTLSPRGDRLVRWLQNEGKDTMMAPDALALMGITNEDRWIPARQLGQDGSDGRYVVSLVNIRNIHEFVFHRRQGDVLVFHNSDTAFKRLTSVRWARNGKPTVIADTAFADSDFQQQIAFWFGRMPGR